MRTAVSYFIALVAGLLVWREARADEPPPSPRGAGPAGEACGAPFEPPCDGWEHKSCHDGRIQKSCCPKGAKCNYAYAPYQECGDGRCVQGHDLSMCPPRPVRAFPAATEAECTAQHGSWEPACVDGQVKPACIPPVPTNFSGPAFNPPFTRCGEQNGVTACTTSQFAEACFPVRTEGVACEAGWVKVCLMGQVTERCPPAGVARTAASQGFVECGDGRCAIGDDQACRKAP